MTSLSLAIVFPAILVLMFLVVQAGIYWHAQQWANAGADRAVARASEVDVVDREGAGVSAAVSFLSGSSVCASPSARSVETDDATVVTFAVTCRVRGPLSGWVPDASATATGPVERFVPETERG